jgi:dihydroorotase
MELRVMILCAALILAALTVTPYAGAQAAAAASPEYDLLLKGGHVIDAKNNIDALMDVAIRDGKIAKVSPAISARWAIKTVNVTGMYVVPGLVDIHVHAYAGTGEKNSYAGDLIVYPDGFTFRSGVTTVVDAGSFTGTAQVRCRVFNQNKTRERADDGSCPSYPFSLPS